MEVQKSEILENLNGQKIIIPTFEHVRHTSERVNNIVSFKRVLDEGLGAGGYIIIMLLKLGLGRQIQDLKFQGLINREGIEWNGNIKAEKFDIKFDEIYQGRSLELKIPKRTIECCSSEEYIELPKTFQGKLIETGIGIMGILDIGGDKVNITDHNF